MSYRSPAPAPEDREALALALVGRRVRRARLLVSLLCVVGSLGAGVVGAALVTRLQWLVLGEAWVLVSMLVGFGGPFAAGFRLSFAVSRRATQARIGAWVREAAEQHRVPPGPLMERAAIWT
ncbi:MAG: hypothetical protein JWM10_5360 [Myxococcaceae bacterium]|nr:hypothetical protein [Myxococcaceae bacterium]